MQFPKGYIRGDEVRKETIKKYEKIDKLLLKVSVVSFLMLILTQFYLRTSIKSIEPFLRRMYNEDNFYFEVIEIVPENNNK